MVHLTVTVDTYTMVESKEVHLLQYCTSVLEYFQFYLPGTVSVNLNA